MKLKLDMNFQLTTDGKTTDNCPDEFYAEFLEVEGPQNKPKAFIKFMICIFLQFYVLEQFVIWKESNAMKI